MITKLKAALEALESSTPYYVRDRGYPPIEDLRSAIAQLESAEPTAEAAYAVGAKGAEATESERLLFEAWMRGHCWMAEGEWNGKQYVHESESIGMLHGGAMRTRQLWAAWRDRAALAAPVQPVREPKHD